MESNRMGSVGLYEMGGGKDTFLSIAKLHGEEECSKDGVLKAMKVIDKTACSIRYVAVPEVNTTSQRFYDGINLNYDFGLFHSEKTRDVCSIVSMYDPILIVDHHDNPEGADGFMVILSNTDIYNSIEFRLAKRLVEHICSGKRMMKACSEPYLFVNADGAMMTREADGIYYYDADFTLTGYLKKGMVIEVDTKGLDKECAADIHKECDLFLMGELEKMACQKEFI